MRVSKCRGDLRKPLRPMHFTADLHQHSDHTRGHFEATMGKRIVFEGTAQLVQSAYCVHYVTGILPHFSHLMLSIYTSTVQIRANI